MKITRYHEPGRIRTGFSELIHPDRKSRQNVYTQDNRGQMHVIINWPVIYIIERILHLNLVAWSRKDGMSVQNHL